MVAIKLPKIGLTTMKKGIIIAAITLTITGCTTGVSYSSGDHASLSGTPKGIRAMMDGMNGLITNGKASPDQDTAHWIARKQEEQEVTRRALKPGLLQGLFASSPKTAQ